jgi:hypothetical protein
VDLEGIEFAGASPCSVILSPFVWSSLVLSRSHLADECPLHCTSPALPSGYHQIDADVFSFAFKGDIALVRFAKQTSSVPGARGGVMWAVGVLFTGQSLIVSRLVARSWQQADSKRFGLDLRC